jgi:hypothetical protein
MKASYNWNYRSMTATYSGSGEVSFNCAVDDDPNEIAHERARNKVCQSGVFHPGLVEISNLSVQEGY